MLVGPRCNEVFLLHSIIQVAHFEAEIRIVDIRDGLPRARLTFLPIAGCTRFEDQVLDIFMRRMFQAIWFEKLDDFIPEEPDREL